MCNCLGRGFVMWTNGGNFGARACSCGKVKSDTEAMQALLQTIDRNRQTAKAVAEAATTGNIVVHQGYRVKVTKIRRQRRAGNY